MPAISSAVNFGRWNDLIATNNIYYLIEYDIVVSTQDLGLKSKVNVFPNPFDNFISIENNHDVAIESITIYNLTGQAVNVRSETRVTTTEMDLSDLTEGMYVLKIRFADGKKISKRIVK